MQGFTAICFVALVVGCQAAQLRASVSPVTRVVKLLQGLAKQIEKEGKTEQDLYESYVCWGKSVVSQKTDSNSAATTRISALTTYIADLDAGKVELTTDRVDREKELADITASSLEAQKLRDVEHADFLKAKAELVQGKNALTSAIGLMNAATLPAASAMLALKSELNGGLVAMEAESASLNKVVELGDRYLSKADSVFMRRLITGAAPDDGNMLGKKAGFKMSYKARSGKIQKILAALLTTFTKNLADTIKKEDDLQGTFDALAGSTGSKKSAAQTAATTLALETGARGKSKTDAEGEKSALEQQVIDDTEFIRQTTASLLTKKGESDTRNGLRESEVAAISKAVGILYNDDNRDNFKKSYASQGFFLQLRAQSNTARARFGRAATELKSLARKTGDKRIAAIADLATFQGPSAKDAFGPVIAAVDTMLGQLTTDENTDLTTKDDCEKVRMEDTREALEIGRNMDDKTDNMNKLAGEISDIEASVAELAANKEQTEKELQKATTMRGDENLAYLKTNQEDQDAADTVASAKTVLVNYYRDNHPASAAASLVQQQQPAVVDGEAPPPPPSTWAGDYGGKQSESAGIIGMMEMVHEDIIKDKDAAKAEEDQSLLDYNAYKTETDQQILDYQSDINTQNGTKGTKISEKSDFRAARGLKKDEWDNEMQKMKDADPRCEYFTVNYNMRVSNRHLERDGLLKAKAILRGGTFAI